MKNTRNYDAMAEEIITRLGGKENLTFLNHCATRLRVNVKDLSKIDEDGLKKIDGVLGVSISKSDNEVQVIVGQVIEDVFSAVSKKAGDITSSGGTKSEKKGLLRGFANFLMMMAGIMSPDYSTADCGRLTQCIPDDNAMVRHVFRQLHHHHSHLCPAGRLLLPADLCRLYLSKEIQY